MEKVLGCLMMLLISMSCLSKSYAGQWSCLSFDRFKRSYQGSGATVRSGMASARRACIKQAAKPTQCRVSHNWCRQGDSPLLNAVCQAEDEVDNKFVGRGLHACEQALNKCKAWQQKLRPSDRRHCMIVHS